MILTTNRPIHFDEAFHSRIDITLAFEELDEAARLSVWKNFLRALEVHNVHEGDLGNLTRPVLNGRQIKNVVKMATLLAESEGAVLCMEHFVDVFEVVGAGCGGSREVEVVERRRRARSESFKGGDRGGGEW